MMDCNVLVSDLLENHGIPASTSHLEDRNVFHRDYCPLVRGVGSILSSARAGAT
jgi:hypothetical protein